MTRATQHRNVTIALPIADWRLLDRYSAKKKKSKNDVLSRHLEPLLQMLREMDNPPPEEG